MGQRLTPSGRCIASADTVGEQGLVKKRMPEGPCADGKGLQAGVGSENTSSPAAPQQQDRWDGEVTEGKGQGTCLGLSVPLTRGHFVQVNVRVHWWRAQLVLFRNISIPSD